jgi:transcriptional regulator with XRE-family HTH domain
VPVPAASDDDQDNQLRNPRAAFSSMSPVLLQGQRPAFTDAVVQVLQCAGRLATDGLPVPLRCTSTGGYLIGRRWGMAVARPLLRGDRLQAAREAAGMSREDLALKLELSSPARIRVWELALERPRPRFVPRLAAALGVEPLYLLDADPEDPPRGRRWRTPEVCRTGRRRTSRCPPRRMTRTRPPVRRGRRVRPRSALELSGRTTPRSSTPRPECSATWHGDEATSRDLSRASSVRPTGRSRAGDGAGRRGGRREQERPTVSQPGGRGPVTPTRRRTFRVGAAGTRWSSGGATFLRGSAVYPSAAPLLPRDEWGASSDDRQSRAVRPSQPLRRWSRTREPS